MSSFRQITPSRPPASAPTPPGARLNARPGWWSPWRRRERWRALLLVAGVLAGLQAGRLVPPPPPYPDEAGRILNHMGPKASYFPSLASFEAKIAETIGQGRVPIVVFGNSVIRGQGAVGANVWSNVLQRRLTEAGTRFKVLNFAIDGGAHLGPFLFYHLHPRFPQALFILQWNFGDLIGRRGPHLWMTSEIMLRDGRANRAVAAIDPATISAEEVQSLGMAALNIAFPHLDAFNALRYYGLGLPFQTNWADLSTWSIVPLSRMGAGDREYDEHEVQHFVPGTPRVPGQTLDADPAVSRELTFLRDTVDGLGSFMDRQYPPAYRDRLMLLTLDWNPALHSHQAEWRAAWRRWRQAMDGIERMNSVSLTATTDDLLLDDFADHVHLTVHGQRLLADAVAARILASWGRTEGRGP